MISSEAETTVATAKKEHQLLLKTMREQASTQEKNTIGAIERQAREREHQEHGRVHGRAAMVKRHALLKAKQTLLDEIYQAVLVAFVGLPTAKLEEFYARCLSLVPTEGCIAPAADHVSILKKMIEGKAQLTLGEPIASKAGFRFVGKTTDLDFTIEQLISQVLRPATEVNIAHELFASIA